MNLSLHLAPNIRAFAQAAGRQFTAAEVQTIETTMNAVASLDAAGNVRFDLGAGPVGTLDDAITMLSVGMGAPVALSMAPNSAPARANATERAIATNRAAREGADALKRKQAEDLVKVYGSPWSVSGNMTHAAYIQNVHPELAQRLRREAGDKK